MNEIIEGNKLIAVFMGYTYFPHNMVGVTIPGWKTTIETSNVSKFNSSYNILLGGATIKHKDGGVTVLTTKRDEPKRYYLCRSNNGLQYHSSWNWLKPVIDKIYEYEDEHPEIYTITDNSFEILHSSISIKIEEAFERVVNFIKWYNENIH